MRLTVLNVFVSKKGLMKYNHIKQQIVITGAPSSGKSTTMIRLSSVLGDQAVMVPESAVILLSGGFPAPEHDDLEQIRAFQKAIIQTQSSIEIVFTLQNPNASLMIFDRGGLDGAGFWPLGPNDFLTEFKIDVAKEYAQYDYVLFFELPDRKAFGGINPLRFHDYEQSLESEKKLKTLWENHPHYIEIKATENFEDKIQMAIAVIEKIANK
jgi:predicted ABC-type ATPase